MVYQKKVKLLVLCLTLTEASSLTITRSSVGMLTQKAPISGSLSQNYMHIDSLTFLH